jgi:transitional endoplasmic reticulum ATPase
MTVSVSVDRLVSPEVAVGQQLVRIDSDVMQRCGLAPNDVAEVTVPDGITLLVRVLEPDPADAGTGVIRCDRYLRQGLRTRLGSRVRLARVEPQVVRQVYLQPPLDLLGGHHLADHLLEHLVEDAVVLSPGALVYLPVSHEGNGAAALFQVSKTAGGPGIAGPGTRLSLLDAEQHEADVLLDVSLDDVGGLEK